MAYVIGLLIIYISEAKHRHVSKTQLTKMVSICLGIIFLLWVLLGTNFTSGITEIDIILTRIRQIFEWSGEDANTARLKHWEWALEQWKNSPIFGNGVCYTDTRYSKYVSVTESGLLKRLVELGIFGTLLQYATLLYPLLRGIKQYRKSLVKDSMIIFFLSVIVCFFVEDLILQRYTELEYTIMMWCSIAYIAYCQKKGDVINN